MTSTKWVLIGLCVMPDFERVFRGRLDQSTDIEKSLLIHHSPPNVGHLSVRVVSSSLVAL